MGWLDQAHPEDHVRLAEAWQRCIRTGEALRAEGVRNFEQHCAEHPGLDAARISRRVQGTAAGPGELDVRHAGGQKRLRRHAGQSCAWRAQRTAQLGRAPRDLRNILDALPSMVASWDRNLCNRFANRAFAHAAGMDIDAIRGGYFMEVPGKATCAERQPGLQAALRGQTQHFETSLVLADGAVRHVRVYYLCTP